MSDKLKKKLTKKELKAQNHAKLMANKGSSVPGTANNSNVIQMSSFQKDKDKKAA